MTSIVHTSETDNSIAKLVSHILVNAIEDRATHLYFEPQEKSLQIRIRKEGMLQTALQNLPPKMVAPTLDYLKLSAKIELNCPTPQVGTIEQNTQFGRVKIEITTLPTQFGDSITAKITYRQQVPLALDRLILDRQILTSIHQLIQSARGLILIVGSQDSEVSATLYAILATLNQPDRSIYALDTDFEYILPGINQIGRARGDFSTIETCLDRSPDVLSLGWLVGGASPVENRLSTLHSALEAVARGCLVFATVRADTAGTAIERLMQLGVPAEQLYSSIIGIIAQKTIGRNCDRCRLPHEPNRAELASLGTAALALNVEHRREYYRANRLSLHQIEGAKQMGTLCSKCQGLGYERRLGLYEVSIVTHRLKAAILSGDSERIDVATTEMGMRSFLDLAVQLFRTGDTSLTEVQRCIPPRTLLQNQMTDADSSDLAAAAANSSSLDTALYWKRQADEFRAECDRLSQELELHQEESIQFEHRIEQSRSQVEQSTRTKITLQLLSVVDAIELARTSIEPQTAREAAIQKGYSMLEHKMLMSIKEIGLRITETIGHKFDPHLHEIVQEIGTHAHPTGTILAELKRGYTLSDRVLRLAQVKVAVTPRFS
jgi:type IV pilus assembly protein PilB